LIELNALLLYATLAAGLFGLVLRSRTIVFYGHQIYLSSITYFLPVIFFF